MDYHCEALKFPCMVPDNHCSRVAPSHHFEMASSTSEPYRICQKGVVYPHSQPMGCYDLLHTIGRGNFATVKQAVHVFSGEQVAVKIIDKTKLDATGLCHLLQEVRCMRLVQHPNIVRLYEIIDVSTTMFLVLELADGGDLYDYMLKNEKAMSEKTARHYFSQIVQAVDYCHQLHVVHRDLKPENVLMFRKLRMVKLTDFGFGHFYQPGTSLDTSCGSMRYSSPEILCGKLYDGPAVDVWGMGILLYAMVCGRPPFMEISDSETISAIMDCRYPLPTTLSVSCSNLIARMLVKKPEQRATVPEILDYPWLTSFPIQLSPVGSNHAECQSFDVTDSVIRPVQTVPCHPLVSCRHLSEDAHERIVKTMLDGGLASHPDEIMYALSADEYNNLAATYYLSAERLLRPQHHQLEVEEEFVPVSVHFATSESDDLKACRGTALNVRSRGRPPPGLIGTKRPIDLASVAEMLEELAEEEEPMDTDMATDIAHLQQKTTASPRYSPSTSRRLTSTKSSPHLNLLNKIKEEVKVGQEEEDDFLDEAFFVPMDKMGCEMSLRNRERQLTSPERLKRIERSRRTRSRSGSGSSQTSSDASDNEETVANTRASGSRLAFSRHRHHSGRNRSASSCSHTQRNYSRESSENESPTRTSALVLFPMKEDLEYGYNEKPQNTRKRIPVLQHSQSLMVIPCHRTGKLVETADKSHRKRHSIHRPHSLPPVPHIKLLLEGKIPESQNVSHTSPTTVYISQQC